MSSIVEWSYFVIISLYLPLLFKVIPGLYNIIYFKWLICSIAEINALLLIDAEYPSSAVEAMLCPSSKMIIQFLNWMPYVSRLLMLYVWLTDRINNCKASISYHSSILLFDCSRRGRSNLISHNLLATQCPLPFV